MAYQILDLILCSAELSYTTHVVACCGTPWVNHVMLIVEHVNSARAVDDDDGYT